MQRPRRLSRWSAETRYASAQEFVSVRPQRGLHSVPVGESVVDLLIEDRGAPVTLIVFNASLSSRVRLLPAFQGNGLAEDCGVNLIAVSDPATARGDLDLGWYLGDDLTGPLPEQLGPVLHHAARCLGGVRTVLFGSSGGGYSAIRYAPHLPDALVLAVNPRLDMQASPAAGLDRYLDVAHPSAQTEAQRSAVIERFVRRRPVEPGTGAFTNDVLIYQNRADQRFFNHQFTPFLQLARGERRLYVRTDDNGPGHVAIPSDTVREILSALADLSLRPARAIAAAGFARPEPVTVADRIASVVGGVRARRRR